ncbi:Membrane-bound metal-dependent hydrolase [Candidatus Propionivibrio aalborgensis]|uniref:Membrane-bound metal-dependent hydrolase n=1 Tax=Candidatus Propionivibrio aalborgensis TaxID=1860101 RepID=A0A1A8XES0_9RHOO|nr:Membrane-bound metal-dependent hydrolase [Candidatus Propionivibrio aalborgensis]
MAIQYHRHFTHALAFIPVGGIVAALPWLVRPRHHPNWRPIVAATTIGYATHAVLDACTNYGTHLLWPFSTLRVAWHWVTTIGPLLTLMLLIGLVFAVRRGSRFPAAVALALSVAYVGTAAWQRERALDLQVRIAAARGHPLDRAEMFPTVGNPLLWRSVYQSGNTLYTDRLRVVGRDGARWKEGSTVELLLEKDLPLEARADERVRRDFMRFSYFSAGWTARASADPSVIGDARYSLRTDGFEPIWGVRFHPGTARPTEWVDRTIKNRVPVSELWRELKGTAAGYGSLPR